MKIFFIIIGTICLILGIIGIFVPLLPTTPFLLLAAATYFRGSKPLYDWLLSHKYLGTHIRNFREHRAVPLQTKIGTLILLWGSISYSLIFTEIPLWVRILLFCIAVGVTWHILSFKTLKK